MSRNGEVVSIVGKRDGNVARTGRNSRGRVIWDDVYFAPK
jgi:hypothetical protein